MEYQFASLGPAIRIVVLIFMIAFAILMLALVVVLAALPGRIANARNHPQASAVTACGWVGLPTGILWAVAVVWAFWNDRDQSHASIAGTQDLSRQLDQLENSIAALEAKQ